MAFVTKHQTKTQSSENKVSLFEPFEGWGQRKVIAFPLPRFDRSCGGGVSVPVGESSHFPLRREARILKL